MRGTGAGYPPLVLFYQSMIYFNDQENDLFINLMTLLKIKYFNEIQAENNDIVAIIHEF